MNTNKPKSPSTRPFLISNISIRKRLPILISILLVVVIVIFSWTSYISLRKASFETGKERLRGLTNQFKSVFSQSAYSFLAMVNATANSNEIKTFLKSGGTENPTEAIKALNQLSYNVDSLTLMVELRNADKEQVLVASDLKKNIKADQELIDSNLIPQRDMASKFYPIGKNIYWAAVAPVKDNEKTIGYVIKWRLVLAAPKTTEQLSKLLGSNALLYIGNNDGNLWYDLINIVDNPPVNVINNKEIIEYSRADDEPVIASVEDIPGTPWAVLIEISQSAILKTADRFLSYLILIGFILLVAGFLLALMMSRSITQPLNKLTLAASDIAAGNYSNYVKISQNDELGELANSFNFMVTQVKNSQKVLTSSVREKEIMLKEIHHRVKNNLQIISSLLNLQTTFLKDEKSIEAIKNSQDRIRSMALIHEKLYQTENLIQINLKEYIQELVDNLIRSYHASTKSIRVHIDIENIFMNMDLSISLGLIITELISNSIKHAFNGNGKDIKDEIAVSGKMVGTNIYQLLVMDNGSGLSKDYDPEVSQSLGLQLVKSLIDQIKGQMNLKNNQGTQYEITFPLFQEKMS